MITSERERLAFEHTFERTGNFDKAADETSQLASRCEVYIVSFFITGSNFLLLHSLSSVFCLLLAGILLLTALTGARDGLSIEVKCSQNQ